MEVLTIEEPMGLLLTERRFLPGQTLFSNHSLHRLLHAKLLSWNGGALTRDLYE